MTSTPSGMNCRTRIIALLAGPALCLGIVGGGSTQTASAAPASDGNDVSTSGEAKSRLPMCQLFRAPLPCGNSMAVGIRIGAPRAIVYRGSVNRSFGTLPRSGVVPVKKISIKRIKKHARRVGVTLPHNKKKRRTKYTVYQVWSKHLQSSNKQAWKFDAVKRSKFGKRFLAKQKRKCRSEYGDRFSCGAHAVRHRVKGQWRARMIQAAHVIKHIEKKDFCPRGNRNIC